VLIDKTEPFFDSYASSDIAPQEAHLEDNEYLAQLRSIYGIQTADIKNFHEDDGYTFEEISEKLKSIGFLHNQ